MSAPNTIDDFEDRLADILASFSISPLPLPDLSDLLLPAIEILALSAPANARLLSASGTPSSFGAGGTTSNVHVLTNNHLDEHYNRLNDLLCYTEIVKLCTADPVLSRRVAAVQFFNELYIQMSTAQSYLVPSPQLDVAVTSGSVPLMTFVGVRRTREISILTAWIVAATECIRQTPTSSKDSAFDNENEGGKEAKYQRSCVIAAKAMLSANAVFRPSMRAISSAIAAADDNAARIVYELLQKLIAAVLKRLVGGSSDGGGSDEYEDDEYEYEDKPEKDKKNGEDGGDKTHGFGSDILRSTCIKFIETVILCFSRKGGATDKNNTAAAAKNTRNPETGFSAYEEYSLEDLPTGHASITSERLLVLGDDCFSVLRGWVEVGGQVKISAASLAIVRASESLGLQMDHESGVNLRAAGLSFLEAEVHGFDDEDKDAVEKEKEKGIGFEWKLEMRSYNVAINAMCFIGGCRIGNFKVSGTSLARLTVNPPKPSLHGLTAAGVMTTTSAIRASCLKLLRSAFSVASNSADMLKTSLIEAGLTVQAEKALGVAQRDAALKSAGRAARNRANLFYQWEEAETTRTTKRQRETDDAIAKIRASKAARGLGNGIQLPMSMTEACELVLINLQHLPAERPGGKTLATEKTLTHIIDAIESGGKSLIKESSRWYDASGGVSWSLSVDLNGTGKVKVSVDGSAPTSSVEIYEEQCRTAASDAFSRLVASGRTINTTSAMSLSSFNTSNSQSHNQSHNHNHSKLITNSTPANSGSVGAQGRAIGGTWGENMEALRDSIASRLAWTLKGVQPRGNLAVAGGLAEEAVRNAEGWGGDGDGDSDTKMEEEDKDTTTAAAADDSEDSPTSIITTSKKTHTNIQKKQKRALKMMELSKSYPLVSACLTRDLINPPSNAYGTAGSSNSAVRSSLASRILYDAYVQDIESHADAVGDNGGDEGGDGGEGEDGVNGMDVDYTEADIEGLEDGKYSPALDILTTAIASICKQAAPSNNANVNANANVNMQSEPTRRFLATSAASNISRNLAVLPVSTTEAINRLCELCDIQSFETVTVKHNDRSSNSNSKDTSSVAERASAHAAKSSAEKRANVALLALREICFKRTHSKSRALAVSSAVGLCAGRLPTIGGVRDKALKLVMNFIYSRSDELASLVVSSAKFELAEAGAYARMKYDEIKEANEAFIKEKKEVLQDDDMFKQYLTSVNPLLPLSDVEVQVFERVRRATVLYLALCLQNPSLFADLLRIGSLDKVDVLNKAIRKELPRLALSAGKKHGEAELALMVAGDAKMRETPLLLALLDNLAPTSAMNIAPASFVEACFSIQKNRINEDGTLDMRYIIPVMSSLKRSDIASKLPELIKGGTNVFKAGLARGREALGRHFNVYREDENAAESRLLGMSACEAIVCLHHVDLKASELQQSVYLQSITSLLQDSNVYTDKVLMAALEEMSIRFLRGEDLPLAFMRTVILVGKDHATLAAYLCNTLLVRLVTGKVWEHSNPQKQARQWDGFMRAAVGLCGEVNPTSVGAVLLLPKERLVEFLRKYPATKGAVEKIGRHRIEKMEEEVRSLFK